MNRTIKEVTVKQYHYKTHEELKNHLVHFLNFYNFAKRLKALKGRTPYEEVVYFGRDNQKYLKNGLLTTLWDYTPSVEMEINTYGYPVSSLSNEPNFLEK